MRHRPEYVARPGSPGRATYVRARRIWLAVAGLGAVVCVGATLALTAPGAGGAGAPGVPSVTGTTATGTTATGSSVAPTAATPTPLPAATSSSSSATVAGPPITAGPSEITAPSAVPLAGVPVMLRLGDAGTAIDVVPIGVSTDGVLDPPADVRTAGWWVAGPRPGGPGRTVITGHIDSRTAGLGAFAALDDVDPGDRLTVTTADGRDLDYQVTGRDEIEKTQLDPAVLAGSESSDLLLVTCIGVFDTDTRSYESNLLITAVPVTD